MVEISKTQQWLIGVFLITSFVVCQSYSPRPYDPYYSQYGQDKYIVEQLFEFKRDGVFFDIGAHDGISFSNTYFLEKVLGWTGVCVEPQPTAFALLDKNRSCIRICGCVFNETGQKDFLSITGYSQMLSGLVDTYNPQHMERVDCEMRQLGGSKEILRVQAYTVNEICNNYGISHIDFLTIDTEGSEKEILTAIDFAVLDITVISVENNYNDDGINQHLVSKNYTRLCKIGADEIYVKRR